jgi:hypothetical protein
MAGFQVATEDFGEEEPDLELAAHADGNEPCPVAAG